MLLRVDAVLVCAESSVNANRYREERRKSFPTAGNLARKLQEAAEREVRGEMDPQHGQRMLRLKEVRVTCAHACHDWLASIQTRACWLLLRVDVSCSGLRLAPPG